jgi:sugar lactone lactonase YvrE
VADPTAQSILRIDPQSGAQEIISSAGSLMTPVDVALEPGGTIAVADPDAQAVFRIEPSDGSQTVIAEQLSATGIAVEPGGSLVIVTNDPMDANVLYRVPPGGVGATPFSDDTDFVFPLAVAVADNGTLYVADPGLPGVLAVDPVSGAAVPIATGLPFELPSAIAVEGSGMLVVADSSVGGLFRVDPAGGVPVEIPDANDLGFPTGVAVDAMGRLIVSDGDSALGETPRIVSLPAAGGTPTEISSGVNLAFPNGLRVVPEPRASLSSLTALLAIGLLTARRRRDLPRASCGRSRSGYCDGPQTLGTPR